MTYTTDTYNYDGSTPSGVVGGASVPFAHGALSGLGNDDHPQYLTQAEGDALYLTEAEGDVRYVLVGASQGNYVRTTADNTGVTDATAQLQADLVTAMASSYRRLYLPAGTYKISATTGPILNMTAAGCEIFGDGIGKTILQFANNVTLAGDVFAIQMNNTFQYVHDLSIYGGTGLVPGVRAFDGVYADQPASDGLIERVEVVGAQGAIGSSTAFGLGTYRGWDYVERTTTLTAAIVAIGSQIATPASMRGVFPGALIKVEAEYVLVTATTATTFTAVFTATHAINAVVSFVSFGHQRMTFRDCTVRDSYYATAIGVNSSSNRFVNCRVYNIGDTNLRHGFYVQGGENVFDACWAEGCAGYSYHGWKKVPNIESGGDKYVNCVSRNPGDGHLIISGLPSDGTNPSVPNGNNLDRYTEVVNCEFRSSGASVGQCSLANPVVFTGNVLENSKIIDSSGGSIIDGNKILYTALSTTIPAYAAISAAAGSRVTNNHISMASAPTVSTGISVTGNDVLVEGNYIICTGNFNRSLSLNADRVMVRNNYFEGDVYEVISIQASALVLDIQDNRIKSTSGNAISNTFGGRTGILADNDILTGSTFRADSWSAALILRNNRGPINANGRTSATLLGTEGFLGNTTYDNSGSASVLPGYLLKWTTSKLTRIGTADTLFAAVSYAEAFNNEGLLYASAIGSIVSVVTDGAWAAGNVGIASVSSGGKIHDSGVTTAPAAPASYGVFLDSGGGAGTARVMLMKTL